MYTLHLVALKMKVLCMCYIIYTSLFISRILSCPMSATTGITLRSEYKGLTNSSLPASNSIVFGTNHYRLSLHFSEII